MVWASVESKSKILIKTQQPVTAYVYTQCNRFGIKNVDINVAACLNALLWPMYNCNQCPAATHDSLKGNPLAEKAVCDCCWGCCWHHLQNKKEKGSKQRQGIVTKSEKNWNVPSEKEASLHTIQLNANIFLGWWMRTIDILKLQLFCFWALEIRRHSFSSC